tara:strand:- start:396 stop:1262 length:867 start_codon:yes stop_codon:yes gene_type:complete
MLHPSELVLTPEGAIYHLNLKPHQIGRKIIVAGDPGRIKQISLYFDSLDHVVENREFVTHTGTLNGEKITALATGIGTDNIDIVLNELDALVNIDLEKREIKEEHTSLQIVRIGTCGSLQEDVPADEVVVSTHAFGLDGVMNFYDVEYTEEEENLKQEILKQCNWPKSFNQPYLVEGNKEFVNKIGENYHRGITITANGFYAPQGRQLRLKAKDPDLNERLRSFSFENNRIVNYEMETSALYGLSKALGHDACTVCAVVANRYANSFSKNYKGVIDQLIKEVLSKLVD